MLFHVWKKRARSNDPFRYMRACELPVTSYFARDVIGPPAFIQGLRKLFSRHRYASFSLRNVALSRSKPGPGPTVPYLHAYTALFDAYPGRARKGAVDLHVLITPPMVFVRPVSIYPRRRRNGCIGLYMKGYLYAVPGGVEMCKSLFLLPNGIASFHEQNDSYVPFPIEDCSPEDLVTVDALLEKGLA